MPDVSAVQQISADFEDMHERIYGVRKDVGAPIEIRAVRLTALGPVSPVGIAEATDEHLGQTSTTRSALFSLRTGRMAVPVIRRVNLGADPRSGPLLIDEYDTTIVVPPEWNVRLGTSGTVVMEQHAAQDTTKDHADAVTRQIVANSPSSVADEMATTIFRTAHSTIVRDAMDFSAALLGPTGETVAQAVTIPFHLGSVPTAIGTLLDRYRDQMDDGDIFIMNDPFDGGMHLPHMFVVKPAFRNGRLLGYSVAIAHQGDIGGTITRQLGNRQHRDLPRRPADIVDAAVPPQ